MRNNRLMLLDTSCLNHKDLFARYYDQMSRERKNKIDAMKVENGKKLCLGAGILLEKALKEAGIVTEEEGGSSYKLAYGPQGKPYIEGCQDFFFNISHSGSMVAIAVAGSEVGVDIQKLKHFDERLVNYVFNIEDMALAKELLARREAEGQRTTTMAEGLDRIYTSMWAMKESVMKYFGKGLALEPQKIELTLEDGTTIGSKIRVSHPSCDCSGLFISEYSCSGVDASDGDNSSFYGLTVCSDYEEFGPIEFCSIS